MPLEDYNMERITHVRVDDRDFNLYISVCYDTMRLHAWKYDESSIEWESFTSLTEFSDWIQKPIKRVDKKRLLQHHLANPSTKIVLKCEQFLTVNKNCSHLGYSHEPTGTLAVHPQSS